MVSPSSSVTSILTFKLLILISSPLALTSNLAKETLEAFKTTAVLGESVLLVTVTVP